MIENTMLFIYMKKFLYDQSGTSAIEYAVLGVLIAVAIVGSVRSVGDETVDFFECVVDGFSGTTC